MNWRKDFENMPYNGGECLVWAMGCDGWYRPMVVTWSENIYSDTVPEWMLCEDHDQGIRDFTHWAEIKGPKDEMPCEYCNGSGFQTANDEKQITEITCG